MDEVVLRPFRPDEFPLVFPRWLEHAVLSRPNARRRARDAMRRRFDRSGELRDGFLELAVEADGRLVGDIQARQPRYGLPPGVFELGINLFDDADRGRGIGTAAVEQVTELMFTEHAAGRIQASTAVDNAAMRRVLERLGFTLEGIMRGFMPAEGDLRDDYAMYAVTREEWSARSR